MRIVDRIGCVSAGAVLIAIAIAQGPRLAADDAHWSLVPPTRPLIPQSIAHGWCFTPVDAFVLATLEERGLRPSPEETRARLVRRVTLDVTGLPPTLAEVCAFVEDPTPDAYERLVDRLLADPRSGERLAQLWLDLVRYADSDGFEYDTARPWAWKYRDWVIAALNDDMPYGRFVREQIAGDEIAPGDVEKLIPTGLHRLGPFRENAGIQDVEKNRQELLVEMTDAVGLAFLGLTIGCAKCHDHKFDPFSQEDYYRLQAFFAGTIPSDVPTANAKAVQTHEDRVKEWSASVERLQKQIDELEKSRSDAGSSAASVAAQELSALKSQLESLQSAEPKPLETVMAVCETGSETPPTYVLVRGEPGQHGPVVEPRFPESLDDFGGDSSITVTADQGTGRRRALAEWLTAAEHPLTARVMVNRLWQQHFGRGLVATPSDFGLMGAPPSHPELLDWLAIEFVRSGWSIKHMQRLILTSATYRQSAALRDDTESSDPENAFLSRMPARRMDAEMLRDAVLAVTGQLNDQAGGPGFRVALPPEVTALVYKGTWEASTNPSELARRSIYRFVKRNLQPPMFAAFDAPDTLVPCARRNQSTHAGQALILLNSPFIEEQAAVLARRLVREVGEASAGRGDITPYVTQVYEWVLARPPDASEARMGAEFIESQVKVIAADPALPASRVLELALEDFCLVALNLDEFLFY